MTNREIDAMVAENVMGWTKTTNHVQWNYVSGGPILAIDKWVGLPFGRDTEDVSKQDWQAFPHYTTDPSADYAVLAHVRETWDSISRGSFSQILEKMFMEKPLRWDIGCGWWIMYEPGDFSKAALAALGIEVEASDA